MFALPIFTASRPATIVGVHVLNFCVRDGHEPLRRLWRMKQRRSVGSGRRGTKARSAEDIRRAPQPETGGRDTCSPQLTYKKPPHFCGGSLCLRYLFSRLESDYRHAVRKCPGDTCRHQSKNIKKSKPPAKPEA